MGLHGMSIGSILIILLIVVLLFGTKRLRNIGTDLGSALRGFRKGLNEGAEPDKPAQTNTEAEDQQPKQSH